MADKKVAVGDWIDGEFVHTGWVAGVDRVVDPDGNSVGGANYLFWMKENCHDDLKDSANTTTEPGPWFHRPTFTAPE